MCTRKVFRWIRTTYSPSGLWESASDSAKQVPDSPAAIPAGAMPSPIVKLDTPEAMDGGSIRGELTRIISEPAF